MRPALAPAATHVAAASLHAHCPLPCVRQLTQHPPRSAAAVQEPSRLRQSATAQAHKDDATHRREPQPAALSTARNAQSMRSIGSAQRPPKSHSLVMRAPLELFGSVWHRTNTEAQLRPPTTSVPRMDRAHRGGHWAEPHVEDATSRLDLGAERGSDGSEKCAMEKHLPFSQCDREVALAPSGDPREPV